MSIKSVTSHVALVALLAAGPTALLAQTTTQTTPPADGAAVPPADGTTTGVAPTDAAPMAETEMPPQPVEGQITMQSDGTVLASNLMGSSVHSTDDETIGNISDMIINLDGTVEGVVIGVGGFLGLGEKAVAIEMSSLTVTTDENGDARLQSSATREDLEAAEEFQTMEDQAAEQQAAQPVVDTTVPAEVTRMPADGTTTPPDGGVAPVVGTTAPAEGTTGSARRFPAVPHRSSAGRIRPRSAAPVRRTC